MFHVIPAIDVAGGRLAAYTPQGPRPVEAFGGSPMAAAEAFVTAGARWLHVVDMDLAFTGNALNMNTVMAVRRAALFVGAKIQVSGGVVDDADIAYLVDVGADRIVLASGALGDPERVARLVAELGDRLAVGIEVDGDRVRSRGHRSIDLPLDETLRALRGLPAARFVVTAVPRVSELGGPDLGALRAVAELGRPVIAAGGIASVADLRAARDAGAEAAIVGRAAIEGGLDLATALGLGDG